MKTSDAGEEDEDEILALPANHRELKTVRQQAWLAACRESGVPPLRPFDGTNFKIVWPKSQLDE